MAVDPRLLEFARQMRHEPTPCEELLWRELRNRKLRGFKFRRQHPLGRYIADYYSAQVALVVELDGDRHADPEAQVYDSIRHEYLKSLGIDTLRFENAEVYDNLEGVLESILRTCLERDGTRRRSLPRQDWRPHVRE